MKIPYVTLTDGTIIVTLDSSPITIPVQGLNYYYIKKALDEGKSINEIKNLIYETPVDGLWYAYDQNSNLVIKHISDTTFTSRTTTVNDIPITLASNATFLGTYASKQALITAYPEYWI